MSSPTTEEPKPKRVKKRNFSSFNYEDAFRELNVVNLTTWPIEAPRFVPSSFFKERLNRLHENFDLSSYEESKKLVIDAICEEAIHQFKQLKIWKGAPLSSDRLTGFVDYLIAARKGYIDHPMLCIIEAKKDDFEQGLAQCLVEMKACQWTNSQVKQTVDILGIVSNGNSWRFYKLSPSGEVFESSTYSTGDMDLLLGRLSYIFQLCDDNLRSVSG
jgi:hypothetical protein